MRCPPPPARGRGRLELVAGPGPWSFRPPSRSAKLLLFAAEATALQSSVCATPAEPGRCHAHRAHSGPRQRYEPRAARDGRDAGDPVLTPREPDRRLAHLPHSGPRQRYEPRAARDGRAAGDTVLTPRDPLRPGPTAQGAGRPGPTAQGAGRAGPIAQGAGRAWRTAMAGPGPPSSAKMWISAREATVSWSSVQCTHPPARTHPLLSLPPLAADGKVL